MARPLHPHHHHASSRPSGCQVEGRNGHLFTETVCRSQTNGGRLTAWGVTPARGDPRLATNVEGVCTVEPVTLFSLPGLSDSTISLQPLEIEARRPSRDLANEGARCLDLRTLKNTSFWDSYEKTHSVTVFSSSNLGRTGYSEGEGHGQC